MYSKNLYWCYYHMRFITYMQTRHQLARRTLVSYINQQYIRVNDHIVSSYTQEVHPGDNIDIQTPTYTLQEKVQNPTKTGTIIVFNKPKGYVASKADPHNQTIYDILPSQYKNYYYIWRLDKDSHGLLLLTDDPWLVHEYEHPKHSIEKEYVVEVDQKLTPKDIQRILSGIKDEDELLRAIKVTKNTASCKYTLTLHEGKNRHIRRMLASLGYRVIDLQRIREGKYTLGDIKLGERKICT